MRTFVLSMSLAACAGGPSGSDASSPTSPDPTDTGATAPPSWIEHYEVISEGLFMGYPFSSEHIVRRFVTPADANIHEEFVDLADGTVHEVDLDIDVGTSTFALAFADGSYAGTGNLYGEAWAWSSWDSRSEAGDGSYVLSEDVVSASGIVADKEGFAADGSPEWTLQEVLTSITEAEWQAARDAL